jgi:hypothetical protein
MNLFFWAFSGGQGGGRDGLPGALETRKASVRRPGFFSVQKRKMLSY